ncbi:MAG: uroporphyrinogen decarboxylase [Bdellovibrionota bacterium]
MNRQHCANRLVSCIERDLKKMTISTNKPLIDAAFGKTPTRYPVWFLRQAGRYLPEYREIRADLGFVDLCKNPKLAAEVTLQPLRRFDLDGAIIFSDILIPPTAMGQSLSFAKNHGPILEPTVRGREDLVRLRHPDVSRELSFVGEAIAQTKKDLSEKKAMIGFAGAPYTVASYMIEGTGTKSYTEIKRLMFGNTDCFDSLLQLLGGVTAEYLTMQVQYGAEIVMLFDSWAGDLAPQDYRNRVVPVMKALIQQFKKNNPDIPVIYYPGQGSDNLAELGGVGMDVVHVDWRTSITRASQILKEAGCDVTLQGNIDPQVFLGDEAFVRGRVRNIVEEAKHCELKGHIFNVGHGLMPHTPIEALSWAVDELRQLGN